MNYRDDKIRAEMGARRISITELADSAGLSRQTVSQICGGKAAPKLSTLTAIADVLKIPLAELFEVEEKVA